MRPKHHSANHMKPGTRPRSTTVKALAAHLGLGEGTIRRRLNQMADVGLAHRQDGLWYKQSADPDQVAHRLGVAGAGEAQRRWHEYRRGIRRAAVTRWRESQTTDVAHQPVPFHLRSTLQRTDFLKKGKAT